METTNLDILKINFLTNEQYQREKENGNLNEDELYFTENQHADMGQYATKEELNAKAGAQILIWEETN